MCNFKKAKPHPFVLDVLLNCPFEPFYSLGWSVGGVRFEWIDEGWGNECQSGGERVEGKFEGFDMPQVDRIKTPPIDKKYGEFFALF